jgi:hypothetical protein
MRFADEPAERVPSRQLTRVDADDPRGPFKVEKGPFDQFLEDLNATPRNGGTRKLGRSFRPVNRPATCGTAGPASNAHSDRCQKFTICRAFRARPARFELATFRSGGERSIP